MLNETNLHSYQQVAVEHIIRNPYCGLFLEMGLGKTASTLTAIKRLMNDYLEVGKVLVIAPKRVAQTTWTDELEAWSHLKGQFTVSKILGTPKQRQAAIKAQADIYIVNRENIGWLTDQLQGYWPFDTVVIDELSSFKSNKTRRFRALRSIRPKIDRLIGLTGTPAPNGLIDLWPQIYLMDMGERLGKTLTGYREKYFKPGRGNGQVVFDYRLKQGCEESIYQQISDICVSMKAEDWLSLPERIDRTHTVKLSEVNRKRYIDFERDQILQLDTDDSGDISAVNAAALSNKLLQFANGAIYDADRNVHEVHDEKLEKLEELVEAANGKPVLVFYSFRHDVARIAHRLKGYKTKVIDGADDIQAWNDGKIQVMLAHPASAGHGLNLQRGGNIIVWFGATWSLELYQQANARLHRQGQTRTVMVHHLVTEGTLDEDVMKAIAGKADKQEALMQAIKARVKKYKT